MARKVKAVSVTSALNTNPLFMAPGNPLNHKLSMALILLVLSACSPKLAHLPEESAPDIAISGGDREAHGCVATAGYTWSRLLQNCVRLFEAGTALTNAKDPDATSVAYVILDAKSDKAELFLPGTDRGIELINQDDHWVARQKGLVL